MPTLSYPVEFTILFESKRLFCQLKKHFLVKWKGKVFYHRCLYIGLLDNKDNPVLCTNILLCFYHVARGGKWFVGNIWPAERTSLPLTDSAADNDSD